jgi:hypothetical protein
VSRCHICERPREPEDDGYLVAMRNHLYVDACWSCWFKWPDERKLNLRNGSGLGPDHDPWPPVRLEDVVDTLRETT